MNILETGGEYTKRELYNLTRSPRIEKMSAHVGDVLPVDQYLIYEDGENRDLPVEILSVRSGDLVVATNSATAIKEFRAIRDLMEGESFSILVTNGLSKNGRTYLTLALA